MKALITSTRKRALTFILMFFVPFALASNVNAHYARLASWSDIPMAYCSTAATNLPVPTYSCCQLIVTRHHVRHQVWGEKWVSGSCKNADPRAIGDMRCKYSSFVYGTDRPIVQNCQYTYSTGRY